LKASHFSKDIQEFLILLSEYEVKYLIIGGEAVIYYGHARLTGDIDILYEASVENATNLFKTLNQFWRGDIPGIDAIEELMEPGVIIQFGVPPNRIDLLNKIDGVTFQEAWLNREKTSLNIQDQKRPIYFIGINELIKNKETLARYKDLEDLKYLKKARDTKQNS